MVQRKLLRSLEEYCLDEVQATITKACLQVSRLVVKIDGHEERQAFVASQVKQLRTFLWSHVVCYLRERAFNSILCGVVNAVEKTKTEEELRAGQGFTKEVWAIHRMAEMLLNKDLRSLNLATVPMMFRSSVLSNTGHFCEAGLRKCLLQTLPDHLW